MAARPQKEARSLSEINYLASNPPQYPYHPELRESLTLYISRVPGTHDVILSTFRPLKKNVTAEDVANSLYYVHLDTPEDELLAAPPGPTHAVSPRSSLESARSVIPRKPLPASAVAAGLDKRIVSNNSLSGPPPVTASLGVSPALAEPALRPLSPTAEPKVPDGETIEGYRQNPVFQKRRSAGPGDVSDTSQSPVAMAVPIQRQALFSTPPTLSDPSSELSTSAASDSRIVALPMTPPKLATNHGRPMPVISHTSPPFATRATSPGKPGARPSSVTFSLTLIRRDPTTATQCNVGKVLSFQTNVPPPEAATPNLDPDNMGELLPFTQHITIHLDASGYAKYRDLPSRADVGRLRLSSGASLVQQLSQMGVSGSSGDVQASGLKPAWKPVKEGFKREVTMSYSASWTENLKKTFHRRRGPGSPPYDSSNASEGNVASGKVSHARHGSTSTVGSVDSSEGPHSPTLITYPRPGLKPKGYAFLSPWNGRCEFRTSANGRAIKCRHILDPANVKFDPREVAQSIRDAQAVGRSRGDELASAMVGAKPVSELRYNLPHGGHRRQGSQIDSKSKAGHHHHKTLPGPLNKLLHHGSRSSDDEYESDDDFDDQDADASVDPNSLGRELAGGGSRGRRAKLGKLIIHDEGLKMLDLVVAANIGVWWTTWGRLA
ncbi:hypothetical protein VTJ83DRAFT_2821 [Remersonia thermophila]|uniref:Oxidoreductase-like protein n=1 Tax=Remersonia thermophila TaxID=72144 RepID=A0ABR4DCZ8_9PEZI